MVDPTRPYHTLATTRQGMTSFSLHRTYLCRSVSVCVCGMHSLPFPLPNKKQYPRSSSPPPSHTSKINPCRNTMLPSDVTSSIPPPSNLLLPRQLHEKEKKHTKAKQKQSNSTQLHSNSSPSSSFFFPQRTSNIVYHTCTRVFVSCTFQHSTTQHSIVQHWLN